MSDEKQAATQEAEVQQTTETQDNKSDSISLEKYNELLGEFTKAKSEKENLLGQVKGLDKKVSELQKLSMSKEQLKDMENKEVQERLKELEGQLFEKSKREVISDELAFLDVDSQKNITNIIKGDNLEEIKVNVKILAENLKNRDKQTIEKTVTDTLSKTTYKPKAGLNTGEVGSDISKMSKTEKVQYAQSIAAKPENERSSKEKSDYNRLLGIG